MAPPSKKKRREVEEEEGDDQVESRTSQPSELSADLRSRLRSAFSYQGKFTAPSPAPAPPPPAANPTPAPKRRKPDPPSPQPAPLPPSYHFDTVPPHIPRGPLPRRLARSLAETHPMSARRYMDLSLPSYVRSLRAFRVSDTLGGHFDRRVTVIQWHPDSRFPTTLALASKGGDVIWWDQAKYAAHRGFAREGADPEVDAPDAPFLYGQGAGGSITAMKFHPTEPNMIFTASIDGTLRKQDFEGRSGASFLDTMHREKWFTALDVQPELKLLLAGSNTGVCSLVDFEGRVAWSGKLHKGKCHDVEFHPVESHLVVTAGNDKVARVWDVRMMRKKAVDELPAPLQVMEHQGIINCATFSPFAPYTLLTTSQNSECRFYDLSDPSPALAPACILPHPHRPFQHLTPIKAEWSPVHPDLCVVGRYPEDAADRRTVDVFQYKPGAPCPVALVARIEDPRVGGIQCLAKFNNTGDVLATCSGFTTYLWTASDLSSTNAGGARSGGGGGGGGNGRGGPGGGGGGPGGGPKRKPRGKEPGKELGKNAGKEKGSGKHAA
ncbi:WD40-repeat-containing domain protein [Blyttiomyces helicus]|uniref:DNA damage-binding protein 2 n=1 Tax=Blyttiomyces helicus TaxID=388810 RepID=A0A4P9WPB0_9FUNG|nr:WD40-repeat-containing domain protein [Blyttiomyces helicus]|eukprot:RKO93568.1 WD40-repeat-containing domain protein [Blyttiomyces helicus]